MKLAQKGLGDDLELDMSPMIDIHPKHCFQQDVAHHHS